MDVSDSNMNYTVGILTLPPSLLPRVTDRDSAMILILPSYLPTQSLIETVPVVSMGPRQSDWRACALTHYWYCLHTLTLQIVPQITLHYIFVWSPAFVQISTSQDPVPNPNCFPSSGTLSLLPMAGLVLTHLLP